ncbi:MAG: TetR/AcrR family transcriptional regulator [Candidatus Zipacnadales bacterium]
MSRDSRTTILRKAAIMEAAIRVFAAHGFDGGTIRQIATEAGVSEGLIYRYFESKEALLDAVIRERSILPWLAQPESLPDDLPVEQVLRALVQVALDRLAESADCAMIVWSQVATNRRIANIVGGMMREVTDRLASYLDRKIARGELRRCDAQAVARMIAATLLGFTLQQYRLSPPLKYLSPQQFADDAVDLLMHGMAPTTNRTPRKEEIRDGNSE